jgi:CRP-like cAMP-binding protein
MSAEEILKNIFPMLSEEAIERINEVARVAEYPDGETLCREAALEDVFYVILEGAVDVYKRADDVPQHINRLETGACFGEIALLLDTPRTATIVSSGPVRVLEIDRETFDTVLKANPEIVTAIHNFVLERALKQEKQLLSQISSTQIKPPAQVFLSYARADAEFATRLVEDLRERGINVWYDRQITGGNTWYEEIQKALDDCEMMIVVLSPRSMESRNVADEWHYYLDENKRLVPVLYEDCRIPYQLRRIQHIDFVTLDYSEALRRLVATLRG